MDRIQRGQIGTLNAYWERDGVAYDPGITLVTITNDEGTVIETGQATSGTGSGGRTYQLSLAATSMLDFLTAVWTAADGSTLTTYAEIVSDFHWTVAYARSRSPLQDTNAYPTAAIVMYRTLAEMALEDICGVSFVQRYRHDPARIVSWGLLEVPRRKVSLVRNIFWQQDIPGSGGASQQVPIGTLSGLRIDNGTTIWLPGIYNLWSVPVTVAYESGYAFTPPRVARASFELARRWLIESPWDERTTGFRTRDGGQMTILTGNHTDAFDIPEVVAVADAYGMPMIA